MIAESEDRSSATKLLPLLDDKAQSKAGGLSIGDHAANTIAALIGREERTDGRTSLAYREEIMRMIRTWVEDE